MNNERFSFMVMLSNGYKWSMISFPFIVIVLMTVGDMTFSDILSKMFSAIGDGTLAFFLAIGDYIFGPIVEFAKTTHFFVEMFIVLGSMVVIGVTLIFLLFALFVIPVWAVFMPGMIDAWQHYDYGEEFVAPMIEGVANDVNMSHDNPVIRQQAENIDLANRITGKY